MRKNSLFFIKNTYNNIKYWSFNGKRGNAGVSRFGQGVAS